jgi:hypothetical protein
MQFKFVVGLHILIGLWSMTDSYPFKQWENDPNYRTTRLLDEDEDLRQAREEGRRFWMNNPPSGLKHEKKDK